MPKMWPTNQRVARGDAASGRDDADDVGRSGGRFFILRSPFRGLDADDRDAVGRPCDLAG